MDTSSSNLATTRVTTLATETTTTIATTQSLSETSTSSTSGTLQTTSSATARTLERETSSTTQATSTTAILTATARNTATARDVAMGAATTYDDDESSSFSDSESSCSDILGIFEDLSSDSDIFNSDSSEEEDKDLEELNKKVYFKNLTKEDKITYIKQQKKEKAIYYEHEKNLEDAVERGDGEQVEYYTHLVNQWQDAVNEPEKTKHKSSNKFSFEQEIKFLKISRIMKNHALFVKVQRMILMTTE